MKALAIIPLLTLLAVAYTVHSVEMNVYEYLKYRLLELYVSDDCQDIKTIHNYVVKVALPMQEKDMNDVGRYVSYSLIILIAGVVLMILAFIAKAAKSEGAYLLFIILGSTILFIGVISGLGHYHNYMSAVVHYEDLQEVEKLINQSLTTCSKENIYKAYEIINNW